jgi:hypothetical protein
MSPQCNSSILEESQDESTTRTQHHYREHLQQMHKEAHCSGCGNVLPDFILTKHILIATRFLLEAMHMQHMPSKSQVGLHIGLHNEEEW